MLGKHAHHALIHIESLRKTLKHYLPDPEPHIAELDAEELPTEIQMFRHLRDLLETQLTKLRIRAEDLERFRDSSAEEATIYQTFLTRCDYPVILKDAEDLLKKTDTTLTALRRAIRDQGLQYNTDDDASSRASDTEEFHPIPTTTTKAPAVVPPTLATTPETSGTSERALAHASHLAGPPAVPSVVQLATTARDTLMSLLPTPVVDPPRPVRTPILAAPAQNAPPSGPTSSPFVPHPLERPNYCTHHDGPNAFVEAAILKSDLPSFNGDHCEWPSFIRTFNSYADAGRIGGADKLSMLRKCLHGDPKLLIEGLDVIDENFDFAMKILLEKYDKPLLRRQILLRRLKDLPPCHEDGKQLRTTYLKLVNLVHRLCPNGEPSDPDVLRQEIIDKLPFKLQVKLVKSLTKKELGIFDVLTVIGDEVETEEIEALVSRSRPRQSSSKDKQTTPPPPANSSGRPEKTPAQPDFGGKKRCRLCQGDHFEDRCGKFTTPETREREANRLKLCLNCFTPSHPTAQCRSNWRCYNCKDRHHSSICRAPRPPRAAAGRSHFTSIVVEASEEQPTPESSLVAARGGEKKKQRQPLFCAEASVFAPEKPDAAVSCVMIFDTGSTTSYITETLANSLKLPVLSRELIAVDTFSSTTPVTLLASVHGVGVKLKDGRSAVLSLHGVPVISSSVDWMKMEDDGRITRKTSLPSILIGLDLLQDLFLDETFSVRRHGENLLEMTTPIGPLIYARKPKSKSLLTLITSAVPRPLEQPEELTNLENLVTRFFSLEGIGITESPEKNVDHSRCVALFNDSIRYDPLEHRYYVSLPFKCSTESLPSNYGIAYRRLLSAYSSLSRRPRHLEEYDAIFREYLSSSIIEEVPPEEKFLEHGVHYLPHHGVVKETSSTTKVRSVLDGSAHLSDGPSINDCLYTGPTILPDLSGCLLRTRFSLYLVSADIRKAFLMVGLNQDSRDYVRILWVRDLHRPPTKDNLVIWRFLRVPFGLSCSPFLLAATVAHHLKTDGTTGAELVAQNDVYVDNYYGRAETLEEAYDHFVQARAVFDRASMTLREFVCNDKSLNERFVAAGAAADNLDTARVLGVPWNLGDDHYSLAPQKPPDLDIIWTKRRILKLIASNFDPLGIATPAVLLLKLFLQDIWKDGYDWDQPLSLEDRQDWIRLISPFDLSGLSVPRRAVLSPREGSSVELHIFVDASKLAFAAVAYTVTRAPDGRGYPVFLTAKARVAPLKAVVQIPRMELLANYLGAALFSYVKKETSPVIRFDEVYLWTDSMICLHWLRDEKKKDRGVFVRNRVEKITSLFAREKILHVPGELNPADCASRGITTDELKNHPLWWRGPPFLTHPSTDWPPQPEIHVTADQEVCLRTITESFPLLEPSEPLIDGSRYSSWSRMRNVLVTVLLFSRRAGRKIARIGGALPTRSSLSATAELLLFRMAQDAFPPTPQVMKQLRLYRCTLSGLWRCRGRIDNPDTPLDTSHPILLPRESSITRLFILWSHTTHGHFGEDHVLCDLRQRVWIPKARMTIRSTLHSCKGCSRAHARPYLLPEFPVHPEKKTSIPRHPFFHSGMDLAGPLSIRGEDGTPSKAWILLLTCLNTRNIYLDTLPDMTTSTLLSRIRRFVSTHGTPATIICDNARQFVTLNELQVALADPSVHLDIIDYFSTHRIHFSFITAFSPWSGGFYERMVGTAKRAIKSSIGSRLLRLDELTTYVKEAEAVVNTRPLTHVSSELTPLSPLRPCDFLRPGAALALPRLTENSDDEDDPIWKTGTDLRTTLIDQWKKTTKILDGFWKRWKSEYLVALRERYTRDHPHGRLVTHDTPQLNDVVIIAEELLDRGQWKIGQICGSRDDYTRSAIVRLASGSTVSRPISLLYRMEVTDDREKQPPPNQVIPPPPPQPATSHPMTTRARARNLPSSLTLTVLAVLALSHFSSAIDTRCPDSTTKMDTLYVTPCVSAGMGIYRVLTAEINDGYVCWSPLSCPTGHLQSEKNRTVNSNSCGAFCPCRSWTKKCSSYAGLHANESSIDKLPVELKEFVPPGVCSFTSQPHCQPDVRHGIFNRIELLDGTPVVVKNMDISTVDVLSADDYNCFSHDGKAVNVTTGGPFTGSPHFCRHYDCEPKNRRVPFCFFGPPASAYVYRGMRIPVAAWGSVRLDYFPFPSNSTTSDDRNLVSCSRGGLSLHPTDHSVSLHLCIDTVCTLLEDIRSISSEVIFPLSLIVRSYEVKISSWTDGRPGLEWTLSCSGNPLCDSIQCKLCFAFLIHYQCWSWTDYVTGFVLLLFIGYVASILGAFILCASVLKSLLGTILFLLTWILPFLCSACRSCWSKLRRRSRPRNLRDRVRAAFGIMLLSLPLVSPCSEITTLVSQEHSCTSNGSWIECTVADATLLSLRPIGLDACLILRSPEDKILGTLTIQVSDITHECEKQTMFYTRSHHISAQSHHSCGDISNSGACGGIRCSAVLTNTSLPFFADTMHLPGYTFCTSSCGCVSCSGCISCSPSCIFYRISSSPTSDTVFEAYRCVYWKMHVRARITLEIGTEKTSHVLDLEPGATSRWNEISATLLSVSSGFTPILGWHYLTDGHRTTLIEDSPPGLFTPETPGQLQCSSQDKAKRFDCVFRPHVCTCTTAINAASCFCPDGDVERFFHVDQKMLPLQRNGIRIEPKKHGLVARTTSNAALQLQLRFNNLRLEALTDQNKCRVEASSVSGCYNCIKAATFDALCISSHSDEHATAVCVDSANDVSSTVIVPCSTTGTTSKANLHWPLPVITANCTVSCPGGQSSFTLDGTLAEEEEPFGSLHLAVGRWTQDADSPLGNFIGGVKQFVDTTLSFLKTIPIVIGCVVIIVAVAYFLLLYRKRRNTYQPVPLKRSNSLPKPTPLTPRTLRAAKKQT